MQYISVEIVEQNKIVGKKKTTTKNQKVDLKKQYYMDNKEV